MSVCSRICLIGILLQVTVILVGETLSSETQIDSRKPRGTFYTDFHSAVHENNSKTLAEQSRYIEKQKEFMTLKDEIKKLLEEQITLNPSSHRYLIIQGEVSKKEEECTNIEKELYGDSGVPPNIADEIKQMRGDNNEKNVHTTDDVPNVTN